MNYLMAFLFAGALCAFAEVILDNTKLTPGHITSLYTVMGAFLSFLGCFFAQKKDCGTFILFHSLLVFIEQNLCQFCNFAYFND